MEKFQVIQPSVLLAPFIKQYWFLKTNKAEGEVQRIVPVGGISLIFHREDLLYSLSNNEFQPRAFLCGQSTNYSDLLQNGMVDMIAVVFNPIGAAAFFSFPMNELNNDFVPLDALSDLNLKNLDLRLRSTENNEICARLIDDFFFKRLSGSADHNYNRLNVVIRSINHGVSDVKVLAQTACLSYKQFNRIFSGYVGTGPKDFLRIVRFQRALYHMQNRSSPSLTNLALECGFYDQSHLIRDFKLFSGYTPTEYLAVCAPFSDYFS